MKTKYRYKYIALSNIPDRKNLFQEVNSKYLCRLLCLVQELSCSGELKRDRGFYNSFQEAHAAAKNEKVSFPLFILAIPCNRRQSIYMQRAYYIESASFPTLDNSLPPAQKICLGDICLGDIPSRFNSPDIRLNPLEIHLLSGGEIGIPDSDMRNKEFFYQDEKNIFLYLFDQLSPEGKILLLSKYPFIEIAKNPGGKSFARDILTVIYRKLLPFPNAMQVLDITIDRIIDINLYTSKKAFFEFMIKNLNSNNSNFSFADPKTGTIGYESWNSLLKQINKNECKLDLKSKGMLFAKAMGLYRLDFVKRLIDYKIITKEVYRNLWKDSSALFMSDGVRNGMNTSISYTTPEQPPKDPRKMKTNVLYGCKRYLSSKQKGFFKLPGTSYPLELILSGDINSIWGSFLFKKFKADVGRLLDGYSLGECFWIEKRSPNGKSTFLCKCDRLIARGDNSKGQLGMGMISANKYEYMTPVNNLNGWMSDKGYTLDNVYPGNDFTFIVLRQPHYFKYPHLLYAAGNNKHGSLGLGNFSLPRYSLFTPVTKFNNIVKTKNLTINDIIINDHKVTISTTTSSGGNDTKKFWACGKGENFQRNNFAPP